MGSLRAEKKPSPAAQEAAPLGSRGQQQGDRSPGPQGSPAFPCYFERKRPRLAGWFLARSRADYTPLAPCTLSAFRDSRQVPNVSPCLMKPSVGSLAGISDQQPDRNTFPDYIFSLDCATLSYLLGEEGGDGRQKQWVGSLQNARVSAPESPRGT